MQRLGVNRDRYHGEAIDIDAVQRQTHELALATGWEAETFLELPAITLRGYRRLTPGATRTLYVGTGVHGDEPSGPLAVVELLRQNAWPAANLWLVPCVNPTGFRGNTRENAQGIDLNRDYRHSKTSEIAAHVRWLQAQPQFDLCLLLHEDWEANGFYVYELNPDRRPSLAEPIVEGVRGLCPIETAELVDNWECKAGIIRPAVKPEERPQWAEAIYLLATKTRETYTLETPSDFPLPFRVRTHLTAMEEAFRWFS
jgi:murein peptide amidase A